MSVCPQCGRALPQFGWPHNHGFCSECLITCVPIWTRDRITEDLGDPSPSWLIIPLDMYLPQHRVGELVIKPRGARAA